MPQPQFAIIADDLTGALDASAPFAGISGGVAVATRADALPQALSLEPGVVAVSTRSRELDPVAAQVAVEIALAGLPTGPRIIKKIDSRLKGNLAAELAALAGAPLFAAPAIPECGRIVRDGHLQGFGIETPLSVREHLGPAGRAATIPDTSTGEEMLQALGTAPADAILVGARGLCQALADRSDLPHVSARTDLPHPLCVAVGSTDPITLAQVARLREAGEVAYLPCPGGYGDNALVAAKRDIVLIQATEGTETRPDVVARNLAYTGAPILQACRGMVLTGGATAEAILDRLGLATLRVLGEALPGMPLCDAGDKVVVTKSGGFGEADALLRLAGLTAELES